jgi:hypothetical protein
LAICGHTPTGDEARRPAPVYGDNPFA